MSLDEQKQLTKQLGRLRVFGFFFALSLVAFIDTLRSESGYLPYALDDYLIVIVSVVAIIVVAIMWRRQTGPQLKMANNVLLALGIVALLIGVMAVSLEAGDAGFVADDIPKLIFGAFLIANRFV